MLLDAYKTTVGKHNSEFKNKIEERLLKYNLTSDENLSYEYGNVNGGKIIFITGKNEDEINIPSFVLPILSKDIKNNDIIFLDVRKAVKIKDNFTSIKDITRDKSYIDFAITQAIFTLNLKNLSFLEPIHHSIVKALSGWITSSISNNLMLNPVDKEELNVIVIDYVLTVIDPDKDNSLKEYLCTKLNVFGKVKESRVIEILEKCNREPSSLIDLISNIKNSDLQDRLVRLDYTLLYTVISQSMFGTGIKESLIIAIEHIPTFIGLLYVASSTRLYQKTPLANFLKVSGRIIEIKDTVSFIENTINDVNISNEDNTISFEEMKEEEGVKIIHSGNHTLYVIKKDGFTLYKMYVGDFMDSSKNLHPILEELSNSESSDLLEFIIHSSGGIVTQGKQLWNVINNKFKGRTTSTLDTKGFSMGAILFSMTDKRIVTEVSELMYHNYSGGTIGSGGEMTDKINHNNKTIQGFFHNIAVKTSFITEEEFNRMIDGKELWMDHVELCERGIATHVLKDGVEITAKEYLSKYK